MGNWRKSTHSDANGGDCIEVASTDIIMIRDTADRGGAADVADHPWPGRQQPEAFAERMGEAWSRDPRPVHIFSSWIERALARGTR